MLNEPLTAKEAAKYVRMSPSTLSQAVKSGELQAIRVGERLRYRRKDIDAWLETRLTPRQRAIRDMDRYPAPRTRPMLGGSTGRRRGPNKRRNPESESQPWQLPRAADWRDER